MLGFSVFNVGLHFLPHEHFVFKNQLTAPLSQHDMKIIVLNSVKKIHQDFQCNDHIFALNHILFHKYT